MNQGFLFFPCLALILLILSVLIIMFRGRKAAVASGEISAAYFKTYDTGETVPRKARQAERCFSNLLESAPIFFSLCLFTIALDKVDMIFLVMAWAYVLVRVLHSFVHITSNKIGPRAQLFMLGWVVMLVFGFRLAYLIL